MPQGRCVWTNVTGKAITLTDTSLLHLTEIERKVLQKVALAKLQALNLGVNVRIPSGKADSSFQLYFYIYNILIEIGFTYGP